MLGFAVSLKNRIFFVTGISMTDPVLNVLSNLSSRNRDVKFAGEDRLRDDVTCRRYVGVVDASAVALTQRLTDAGVAMSELRFTQDTDGDGMQLAIISKKGEDNFAALRMKQGSNLRFLRLLIGAIILVIWAKLA